METGNNIIRKILSNENILAWVLRDTTAEFQGVPIDTITKSIKGAITAISDTRDERVRFLAIAPDGQPIKFSLNINTQSDNDRGYDLVTRAVFECTQMLSAQRGTGCEGPKKVYSIWICTNAPRYAQNTITQYHMSKDNLAGNIGNGPRYDLLTVVMVYLGPEGSTQNGAELHNLLSVLLSTTLTSAAKEAALKTKYGIKISL